MDTAQELCLKMGQPWRVATLNGWKLFHDPNMDNVSGSEKKLPVEGNFTRDIWKRSAWALSEDESLPLFERAIYSALCGNAQQLLNSGICTSWEDKLWALTRTSVDVRVEREIRETLTLRSYVELPQAYWDNKVVLEDILISVASRQGAELDPNAAIHRKVQVCHCFLILSC